MSAKHVEQADQPNDRPSKLRRLISGYVVSLSAVQNRGLPMDLNTLNICSYILISHSALGSCQSKGSHFISWRSMTLLVGDLPLYFKRNMQYPANDLGMFY